MWWFDLRAQTIIVATAMRGAVCIRSRQCLPAPTGVHGSPCLVTWAT